MTVRRGRSRYPVELPFDGELENGSRMAASPLMVLKPHVLLLSVLLLKSSVIAAETGGVISSAVGNWRISGDLQKRIAKWRLPAQRSTKLYSRRKTLFR